MFLFNFLFWLLGAVLVAVGLYAIVDKWNSGESFRWVSAFPICLERKKKKLSKKVNFANEMSFTHNEDNASDDDDEERQVENDVVDVIQSGRKFIS